jgi:hypothetical protein
MDNIADKLVEIVSNRGSPSIVVITNQPAAPPQTTVAESLKSLQKQFATGDYERFGTFPRHSELLPTFREERRVHSSSVTRVPKKLKKERQNVHPVDHRLRECVREVQKCVVRSCTTGTPPDGRAISAYNGRVRHSNRWCPGATAEGQLAASRILLQEAQQRPTRLHHLRP